MFKKGDTLIEVCIAIGIFSLIAIGVAAVMSSGVAGSQTALETTLSREEIDAQADALRFIHASRMREQNDGYEAQPGESTYSALWDEIVANAIPADDPNITSVTQYNPTTCSSLYTNENSEEPDQRGLIAKQKGFVIDTRKLTVPGQALKSSTTEADKGIFDQAQTYPRLIYEPDGDLSRAEGLYIVAVKDKGTQMIVESKNTTSTSAYYDFYVRSCWYGTDADRPTAISTVIRLYDPPAVEAPIIRDGDHYIRYYYTNIVDTPAPKMKYTPGNPVWIETNENIENKDPVWVYSGIKVILSYPTDSPYYYRFKCWGTNENNCEGEHYTADSEQPPIPLNFDYQVDYRALFAIWDTKSYTVTYESGEGSVMDMSSFSPDPGLTVSYDTEASRVHTVTETVAPFTNRELNYTILNLPKPRQSGWSFRGWCTEPVAKGASCAPEKTFQSGATYGGMTDSIKLYAIWSEYDLVITAKLTWDANPRDLDSHVEGQKSDGSYFHTYYGSKTYSEGITIASLDRDVTSGYGPETITLHTLGGRNYYYYIKNFTSDAKITNATVAVTVQDPSVGTTQNYTFKSNASTGSGRFWNVFAYKDGEIVTPRPNLGTTSTSSPDLSY